MSGLFQDLRYALRQMSKSPGFTLVAVITLALGIGANTAVFSVVDWLVLRPLPIKAPEQMTILAFPSGNGNFDARFFHAEFEEIRQQTADVFSDAAAFTFGGLENGQDGLTVEGSTNPIMTVYVSGSFFPALGISPYLGRFILPSEGSVPGADPVMVISYRYWQSRFGGNPSIVGKTVLINGHPVTIVGIAPKGFLGIVPLIEAQGYLPLGMTTIQTKGSLDFLNDARGRSLNVMARIRPGVDIGKVQSLTGLVGQRLLKQSPRDGERHTLQALPLRPFGPPLITSGGDGPNPFVRLAELFMTLAGLVLLLVCVNVANLFLVRAIVRQNEMALRAALGAGRRRLLRQLLTESFLLAGLACIAGIALGIGASQFLSSVPLQTNLPVVLDLSLDWRVFTYALMTALFTGILVGLVPALRVSFRNLREMLLDGGRTATSAHQRLRSMLVALQIGGALALLIVAGLFVRSFQSLQRSDLGFDPRHVFNLSLDPSRVGYTSEQAIAFYRDLLGRVRGMPGVESASLAAAVPLGDNSLSDGLTIPGHTRTKEQPAPSAGYNAVSPGYFKTMGMVMLSGRDLSEADNANSAHVAVINQAMADHFWPRQDPTGRQFTMSSDPSQSVSIVGVVKNSRMNELYGPFEPLFFVPIAQHDFSLRTLQIRIAGTTQFVVPGLVKMVRSLAPAVPIFGERTMTESLQGINGLLLFRLGAGLATTLGMLGLILAIVGVYGVMSYAVNQRTKEIGIRMALGAKRIEILRMICRNGLFIIGMGMTLGILGAFAVGRLVGDFLVGIRPSDPITYAGVSGLIALVALLACYVPARRAANVDPMVALRYE
jgi:macrolide transport system ATP-binding/permease protein